MCEADLDALSVEDIKRGYTFSSQLRRYTCLECGAVFEAGEVYPFGSRLLEAFRAVREHVKESHGPRLAQLLEGDSRYLALTDTQKKLLTLFAAGLPDSEVARRTGVSPSTVRHQRFSFREKAKQAKLYLAAYGLALEESLPSGQRKASGSKREAGAAAARELVPVQPGAKAVDDRYRTTFAEREAVLQNCFYSLEPLKLKVFSAKEKKKLVILSKIAESFSPGRSYGEREVNDILKGIYEDYVTLQRYLIEYGFLDRDRDGSRYWVSAAPGERGESI